MRLRAILGRCAGPLGFVCAIVTVPIAAATPAHPDDMQVFAEAGERMVIGYLDQMGIPADSAPTLTFIPSGGAAASQCVDGNGNATQHDRSFDYCATDNAVYIGENTLWDSYRLYRAAGPLSGLAHEYGHFLQRAAGVPRPNTATDTIRNENQADCFSGAFIGYLHDRGEMPAPEDVESVKHYLTGTASEDDPGRDHGTARERIESFELGYDGALAACNQFNPATPLTR